MEQSLYQVEKMAHGGMGIVRERGHAIFVFGVIPGEKVRIRLTGSGKVRRAVPTEIVSPSPLRVDPPCRLFMKCGGCQLQHMAYPAQAGIKREVLVETLERIGRVGAEVEATLAAPGPYHYRSRIRLQVSGGRIGFFAAGRKDLVPVDYCHLAREELNFALPGLGRLIKKKKPGSIELISSEGGLVAVLSGLRGRPVFRLDGGEWKPDPEARTAFTQVNPEQNHSLLKLVEKAAAALRPETALELYAGSGNLTRSLVAAGASVLAVEKDPAAVDLGRARSESGGWPVEWRESAAGDFLESGAGRKLRPGLVLLDPPRTGAVDAVPGIARIGPSHVIYVSCEPSTLARDAKELLNSGYILNSVTPVDMFPQTAHIESMSVFSRV